MDDAPQTEKRPSQLKRILGVGEDVAHLVEAAFSFASELFTKTVAIVIAILVIGILLLAARDVLYSAAAWSSTQLTIAVVAWDAWVVINDIVDIEFKAIVAALELIADALHFLGLTFIPTFSLSQITKRFEAHPHARHTHPPNADTAPAGPNPQSRRHHRGRGTGRSMRKAGGRARNVRVCNKARAERRRVPNAAVPVPNKHWTSHQRL